LAEELKRLEPHVKARLKERAEAAAENVAALGLEDPVEIVEAERRKEIELGEADAADVEFGVEFEDDGDAAEDPLAGFDFDSVQD
jgi:hypothetical protein